MQRKLILLLMILSILIIPTAHAQDVTGTASGELNVRTGPGTDNSSIGKLAPQQAVIVEARNEIGDWILIRTTDGSYRGWVASRYVYLSIPNVQSLPLSQERFSVSTTSGAASGGEAQSSAPPAPTELQPLIDRLEAFPVLHNMGGGGARTAHSIGQSVGNRPNVFTRVGDSVTVSQPFLLGFGTGDYNLGEYGYLQDTINFFNVPPREGYPNSFYYLSEAAKSAFNADAVLYSEWADPSLCQTGESPLVCEYRLSKPSIAIIMLGSIGSQQLSADIYRESMDRIVDTSIKMGVIPVLTTFPMREDYLYYPQSLQFNNIILDMVEKYDIPLINLWKAARQLPGFGTRDDRFHLSQGSTYYTFNGEENQFGVTLRNLLTLQALHEIRANIIG